MKQLYKKILTILILSILVPISIQAQVLDVPEITQQEDQWCWIGSSICVLKYYGDNQLTQCQIATWTWSRATWRTCNDNCCNNPDGCCNYWNYNWGEAGAIDDILKNVSSQVSIDVKNESGSVSQTEVATAISDGRPFIVRVNSGGHFIVLHGLQGNTLYFMDPWFGEGKGYQTFSTSQVNGRSWTHTQTCLTKPDNDPQPPSKATNPSPADNATNVSINTNLSWSAGSGTSSNEVYFGTSSSPTYQGSQSGTTFDPGTLNENTTYYWRINEVNSEGTTTGDLWQFTTAQEITGDVVGNTEVYSQNTTAANRRAMPFTMTENGTITSISQYHQGGSGNMYLAVYEGNSSTPTNRIGVTPLTQVNSSEGWQTVELTSPVSVNANQTIWLAWVYESTPGIAYDDGSPGRVDADTDWSGGMPGSWGSTASQANYIYSIYASYTPGGSQLPEKASNPSPANNATNMSINTDLSWSAGAETTTHEVYFGTSSSPGYQGSQSGTTFDPGTLNESTTYYWRIDEVNSEGTTTGDLWQFTTESGSTESTVGNTSVYPQNTTAANRRAMPFTMPENGTITSIAQYHQGGSGNMYLAVYEGNSSTPTNRIGVTPLAQVNSSEGWQTVELTSPVSVNANQTIWLAWVYENTPGIAYDDGSPGRVDAGTAWSGGMPGSWGSTASQANYIYSIYANYIPGSVQYNTVGTTTAYSTTTNVTNRRADSYTMPEDGTISSISMYHKGGPGQMILGIYEGESSPTNLLGKTNTVNINSQEGWQTVNLQSPVFIQSGKKIWLTWVLSENAGILVYTSSGSLTPRADAGVGFSSGMPISFGSSSLANYNYSIYATYAVGGSGSGDKESFEPVIGNNFIMHPNPAKNQVTINYNGDSNALLNIINMAGAIVKEKYIHNGENQIDISTLPKGVYIVTINKNKNNYQKLVIQ